MALGGKETYFACFLLVGSVVSLPIEIRQDAGSAFSGDSAKEESFEFLPPRRMTKLELLNVPILKTPEQPISMSEGFGPKVPAMALGATTTKAQGTESRLAVGVSLMILLLMCLYFMCPREEVEGPQKESPQTPKGLDELLAMQNCDGTWARTYRNADGKQKQALELLFRCHIISPEEFAHSRVSKEHIDECVWIASNMLVQRPLEQWLNEKLCGEAQEAFKKHVATCFQERIASRTSIHDTVPLSEGDLHSGQDMQSPPSRADADGRYTRSQRSNNFLLATQQDATSTASERSSPTRKGQRWRSGSPKMLQNPEDTNSLLTRCRQIMGSHDKQWSSMPVGREKASSGAPQTIQGEPTAAASGEAPVPPTSGMHPATAPDLSQTAGADSKYASAKF